jgi:hypothetical protein
VVNVAVVLPPDITAAADENATQLAKLSSDTWIDPEHAPAAVWPVSVAGFIAVVNVTAIDGAAIGVVASEGEVLATRGGAMHEPLPSQIVPPFWLQAVFTTTGGLLATPAEQTSLVHWLLSFSTSLLSMIAAMAPAPSHWFVWQSPAVCAAVTVPAATLFVTQAFPALHENVWHSVSVPHCAAALHCTQVPPALQTVPPPWLQAVLTGSAGCEGTPAVQVSVVHWLPSSAGRSLLSTVLTMLPAPSHWLEWQSPAVCAVVAVPAAALVAPQVFPLQVRVWHSVSVPAHCVAALHCTQAPPAVQNDPPPWLQAVSTGCVGCEGTPAVQISLVHWLPSSTGVSPFVTLLTMLPAPSHWLVWQSPATCALVAVPAAALVAPQTLALQVRV